ncbi:DUF4384 domain-containing protein [Deferribacter thermophilus]|uniref:DUF4384 domain-containing protein n=1 Tax=Deferribacter thermophilus TaxID=53573 RepID=UPI003C1ACEE0
MRNLFFVLLTFLMVGSVFAGEIKRVTGIGSCAIVNMTAEQARMIALQRARADAIENASGVKVSVNTVVTKGELTLDLIKTYSSGYIIDEKVFWLPLGEYRPSKYAAPIPEYRVKIEASVMVSKKIVDVGLQAKLNKHTFIKGDKAYINIQTQKDANIAIFNLMANDRVIMLYPNAYEKAHELKAGEKFVFPGKNAVYDLEMSTLPGHPSDTEAFLVVATDNKKIDFRKLFKLDSDVSLIDFYKKYSKIAESVQEVILPYQVFEK